MKKILIVTAFALASLAAAQDTTTTTTTTTTTDTMNMMTPASMSPADNFAKAQEDAVQADVAYPLPFYDRVLWKSAVDHAYYAAMGEMGNRDYMAYLGQLYTKTQWWINGYNTWVKLGELTDQEKDLAALTAAKLAFIALNRGDKTTARTYVTQGMAWKNTASLQAIMSRL
jgi:hypothetical protein